MGASNNLVFHQDVDEANGKVSIGIARKSGQAGISGFGTVARIKFISRSNTPHATQTRFIISNVVAIDKSGAPLQLSSGEKTITINNTGTTPIVVWPGDTNNDNTVNQADVLPIGLYWGSTGPTRPNASVAWFSQPFTAWSLVATATYADANGDGKIDQADILAIGFNWGKSHATPALLAHEQIEKTAATTNATITPVLSSTAAAPNQEISVAIKVGAAVNLFGLAFELIYEQPQLLQILAIEADSLFGPEVIFYSNSDVSRGKIAVGISRKAGQGGVSGNGVVVRVKARIAANATAGAKINFMLQNLVANDAQGSKLYLNAKASTLIVGSTTSVAENAATALPANYRLLPNHPNPFRVSTAIRYELSQTGQVMLQVYNLAGQEVLQLVNNIQPAGRYTINWNGRDQQGQVVSSGVYICRLQAGGIVQMQRVVVMR
jgi:hypothetical protein